MHHEVRILLSIHTGLNKVNLCYMTHFRISCTHVIIEHATKYGVFWRAPIVLQYFLYAFYLFIIFYVDFPRVIPCRDSTDNKFFTLHKGINTLICVNMTKPEAISCNLYFLTCINMTMARTKYRILRKPLDMCQYDRAKSKILNLWEYYLTCVNMTMPRVSSQIWWKY